MPADPEPDNQSQSPDQSTSTSPDPLQPTEGAGEVGGYQFFVDQSAGTVSGYSFGLQNSNSTTGSGVDLNVGLPDWFNAPALDTSVPVSTGTDPVSAFSATAVQAVAPSVLSSTLPSATAGADVAKTLASRANAGLLADLEPEQVTPKPVCTPPETVSPEPVYSPPETVSPEPLAEPGPSGVRQERDWAPRTTDDDKLRSYKTPEGARLSLVSLYLKDDSRYKSLKLPEDMAISVSRIFGLVDLDFNGYVEFQEMRQVLETDDLSQSEKGIVKLVLNEARKILVERKLPEEGALVALTREDFSLAFAREFNSLYASMGIKRPEAVIPPEIQFKAQLYSEADYPLSSIKPAAVKLGTIGEPYFAAVIAGLALQNPRAILRMVRTNLDHTFGIAFAGSRQPPFDVMPPRTEELVEYGRTGRFGFWYPLLEKSFGIYQAKSSNLAGRFKSDSSRTETLGRVSQIYDVCMARPIQQSVLADVNPTTIFELISEHLKNQKVIIAVARDEIDASRVRVERYPKANKPYPIIRANQTKRTISLGQIYIDDEEPLELDAQQFCALFKLLYFNKEQDPMFEQPEANSMSAEPSSLNPWKKMS